MCNGHGGDLHPRKEQMMGVFGFGRANLLKVSLVLAAAVLAACLLAFVVRVEPSQAAFPGQNGKIAFVSTRDGSYEIYTMNADGSNPTRLTNNETLDLLPAFSPDGTKIVFVRENDPTFEDLNVYVMKADGSGQTDLNNPDLDSKDESPSFSPDGTKIVFASQVYAVESFSDIYVMKADGSGRTNLSNYPASADFDPVFSPDGTRIAFVSMRDDADPFSFFGGEIYVMKADGSGQTNITNNAAGDRSPDWSPDGNKIAFMSNRDGGDYEIYVMNADGSNQTRLTFRPGNDQYPDWSPDGKRIVFHNCRVDAPCDIYVMDADGSNQSRLTDWAANPPAGGRPDHGGFQEPTFSPEGDKIASVGGPLEAINNPNEFAIYVMNADGSDVNLLIRSSGYGFFNPAFSPDGNSIAAMRQEAPGVKDDIVLAAVDGSSQRNLTNNGLLNGEPTFSPDGTKIAFSRDGFSEIYTMNIDGSAQTNISNRVGADHSPD
jgi:Tol biopolymer transport system component